MNAPVQVPPSARIAPLATLPVFLSLAGRKAVVAGNSAGAAWKVEMLCAAGADVQVFAGSGPLAAEMLAATSAPVAGSAQIIMRTWQACDLEGAAIAVGDCAKDEEAEKFVAAAHAHTVPANVIDHPGISDFIFGTIVNRSPIVIGICTSGAAPALGQSIRARIETLVPRGLARWAELAGNWRAALKDHLPTFPERLAFWQRFAASAWSEPDVLPPTDGLEAFVASQATAGGGIALVAAGPGDADLLTIRALQTLQRATVIVHDAAVAPEMLDLGRREALRISSATLGGATSVARKTVALAQSGEAVVRLTLGGTESLAAELSEIEELLAGGIPITTILGVPTN